MQQKPHRSASANMLGSCKYQKSKQPFTEFMSPLYLANLCLAKGMPESQEQIKKYGRLEKSTDEKLKQYEPSKFQLQHR